MPAGHEGRRSGDAWFRLGSFGGGATADTSATPTEASLRWRAVATNKQRITLERAADGGFGVAVSADRSWPGPNPKPEAARDSSRVAAPTLLIPRPMTSPGE
jgi:hypothetical protein